MSKFAIRSTLAGLSLAMVAGFATPVMAAPEAGKFVAAAERGPGKGPQDQRGARHGGMMHGDWMWIPGLGPLSQAQMDMLKLDVKQQEQIKTVQGAQKALHTAMRERTSRRHELLNEQLKSGKLDPRALLAQTDKDREQFRKSAEQIRGQWLAVWDGLNKTQRQQVTEMIQKYQARMQERRDERGESRSGRAAPEPAAAPSAAS